MCAFLNMSFRFSGCSTPRLLHLIKSDIFIKASFGKKSAFEPRVARRMLFYDML